MQVELISEHPACVTNASTNEHLRLGVVGQYLREGQLIDALGDFPNMQSCVTDVNRFSMDVH